jgi:tRNA/rRNA methyltransferase
MQSEAPLRDRVAVVLVGARNPLNIGAVARAMSNFGFDDLRLVNDYAIPLAEARSAVNASHVLEAAREFASVAEAVDDCQLVYGTTAIGERKPEHPVDALPSVLGQVGSGKVAILFGSEKTGLSNEALSHCHRLLTIPMAAANVSMNLGQAAAVILYELVRGEVAPLPISTDAAPATGGQLELLDTVLREALEEAGYMQRFPGNASEMRLRALTRRLQMPGADVPIWLGFFRQFLWKIRTK